MSRSGWQAAVIIVGVLGVPAQAQVELRWKLKEGDKFYLETKGATKQTVKLAGKPIVQEFETTAVDSYKVVKRIADRIILEKKVEAIRVKGSGQEIEAPLQMYQKLKGAVFTLALEPRTHTFMEVEGVVEFVKKAFADRQSMEQVAVAALLNRDTVRDEQQGILMGFLPGKPVRKGEKWASKSNIPFGTLGRFTADGEFTYQGKCTLDRQELDQIDAAWTLTYRLLRKTDKGAGSMITKADFKEAAGKGTWYFDADNGRLVQLERKYRIKGTIRMFVYGSAEVDMEIEIDQTSKFRLLDQPPAMEDGKGHANERPGIN